MSRSWDKKKNKELEDLIDKIRRSKKYKRWRLSVLKREISSSKIPKGLQVHHRKEISHILRDNNVTSLKKAMRCDELWRTDNGVVLKRGEHFILTRLKHYKYLSNGFYEFLQKWLKTCIVGQLEKKKLNRGDLI